MIFMATARGPKGLFEHLASLDLNEKISDWRMEGLANTDPRLAIAELAARAYGTRCRHPLVHASFNPTRYLTAYEEMSAWREFEKAHGLEGQPWLEVVHVKFGRRHIHRVYSRIIADTGKTISSSHMWPKNELAGRIVEFINGEPPTAGAYNHWVAKRLREQGRLKIAEWLLNATEGKPPPTAELTSRERAVQERTGCDLHVLRHVAADAFRRAPDLREFKNELLSAGLLLARGDKGAPVVVDPEGGVHSLVRLINAANKATGFERIKAADVTSKINPRQLPSVLDTRAAAKKERVDYLNRLDAAAVPVARQSRVAGFLQSLLPASQPDRWRRSHFRNCGVAIERILRRNGITEIRLCDDAGVVRIHPRGITVERGSASEAVIATRAACTIGWQKPEVGGTAPFRAEVHRQLGSSPEPTQDAQAKLRRIEEPPRGPTPAPVTFRRLNWPLRPRKRPMRRGQPHAPSFLEVLLHEMGSPDVRETFAEILLDLLTEVPATSSGGSPRQSLPPLRYSRGSHVQ